MKNFSYFIKEGKTIFKVDLLSNVFSIFSIGLIFFILSMIISGWWISNGLIEVLQKEAEINVYHNEAIGNMEINDLVEKITSIGGVKEVNFVEREESYDRMVEILDREAKILELFDENPFQSFIEVKINIGQMDSILEDLNALDNIDYIRDNKNVIDKLQGIIRGLTIIGGLVITATGLSTIVVISHIIRQGIYNNRDQINTLRLLGAPDGFIGLPFVLEGLFLTISGGVLAFLLVLVIFKIGYSQLGSSMFFIPIPSFSDLIEVLSLFIFSLSLILGSIGSIFGLSSAKEK